MPPSSTLGAENMSSPSTDVIPTTPINSAPNKINGRKRKYLGSQNLNIVIDEAQKKINDTIYILNNAITKEEDECDLYAKLLAKKLRKYPSSMRETMMYKIDGLLMNNPYPTERDSSASTYSSYSSQSP